MIEEIARVSAVASLYANTPNSLGGGPLMQAGTPEQLEKYLRPSVENKVKIVFGLTEPGAGSDASGMVTTAVKDGDDYILNGRKCFISGAPAGGLLHRLRQDRYDDAATRASPPLSWT